MRIRKAVKGDLPSSLAIYNEGIVNQVATLETGIKDATYLTYQVHGTNSC
ncbi:hypothetical protein ACFOU2_21750 [Bacillus songklensis]|uniref:Uncharacterized protein n=1 Tax=Bacillus songklensis TaxID=1069116 RepID=A0ABV8B7S8_9BACI